jgi:hypothetical protein
MPDHNARHARTKWEWNTNQGRKNLKDQAVQDDPANETTPAKQKRGECKQNHWGPHEFKIILDTQHHIGPLRSGVMRCQWRAGWGWRAGKFKPTWDCWHAKVCIHCGKRLQESYELPAEECPDFIPEVPVEVLAEVRRKQDNADNLPARRWARKTPAPNGKQGYRKPKAK